MSDLDARVESLELYRKKLVGSKWLDRFTFGMQVRSRAQGFLNYDRNRYATDNDGALELRGRFSVGARIVDQAAAFMQIQGSRVYGDAVLSGPPFGPGNIPVGLEPVDEGVVFHQVYGDVILGDFTLRMGRHKLVFGDQRLVGGLDWENRARSFDGVLLIHNVPLHKTNVFFEVVQRRPNNSDAYFTGFYNTAPEVIDGFDYYGLFFIDGDGAGLAVPVTTNDLWHGTFGGRLLLRPGSDEERKDPDADPEGLGFTLEGAAQMGKRDNADILACAVHLDVFWQFGGAMRPVVTLEYNLASGDDPKTLQVSQFQNLFPTNHNKYGIIDFMGWQNTHNFRVGVAAEPFEDFTAAIDFHEFFAFDPEGAIGAGSAVLPSLAGRSHRHFGHELDIELRWEVYEAVTFNAGYALFVPGMIFKKNGIPHDIAQYGYGLVQVDL